MVQEKTLWTDFFVILDQFLLFYPTNNLKSESFLKMEKTRGDIIISKKCTSHDHMLSCSWDMALDKCNCYFSFWAIFCSYILPTAQKIKILINYKNFQEISSFHMFVSKIIIRWCKVPWIWFATDGLVDEKNDIKRRVYHLKSSWVITNSKH